MRCLTVAVNAEIEHDCFKPGIGKAGVMAPLDPVHEGAGKQAVQEDYRPPFTRPVHGKAGAVETFERFGHHRF